MADPLFTPEAQMMLEAGDQAGMEAFCEMLHPATVADTLVDSFAVDDVWKFLHTTSTPNQAGIFSYFPMEWQLKMVQGAGKEQMAHLIEEMESDDRADLMRRLSDPVREGLMRLVDEADRRDIVKLMQYDENSAGALMTTDYAWLPANITAGEALERLRLQAPDKETINYTYIVDDQRKLLGVVSLRELIIASRRAILSDLMETKAVSVHDTDDREQVAQEFREYDLQAMPVIDAENRLVGIITADDVMDVMEQAATEDVHRMGGVGPVEENYLEAPFLTVWRSRALWLSLLFAGQMFTFEAMAYFEGAMKAMTVLALFVPLCLSTGGNSGSQASTLINRAMALGQVGVGDWFRALRHELLMGLALGLTLALFAALRTYVFTRHQYLTNPDDSVTSLVLLSLLISLAVFAITMYGTLTGSMLPLLFKKLGADPGVASTPFVATFVDVTGIIIYFMLARLIFGAVLG